MKPIQAATCVDAWLQGCDHLLSQEEDAWRDYNIISEIANPLDLPANDRAVVDILSRFLVDRGGLPFSTVVNTIFPAQLYQRHGPPALRALRLRRAPSRAQASRLRLGHLCSAYPVPR